MNQLLPGALAALLLLLPAAALWALRARRLVAGPLRRGSADMTGRIVLTMGVMAVISCLVQSTLQLVAGGNEQQFALFGAVKKVLLPVLYVLLLVALVWPGSRDRRWSRPPVWWGVMAASVILSSVAELVDQRGSFSLSYFAQGILLLGGMLLFAFLGCQTGPWSGRRKRQLVAVLAVTAALEASFNAWMGVFISCAIPVCSAGVYYAIRARRPWVGLGSAGFLGLSAYHLFTDPHSSSAGEGQLAVSLALLVLCLLPRWWRLSLIVLGAVAGAVVLPSTSVMGLMMGHYNGIKDVTLSHRGYETSQVLSLLHRSATAWLFGAGPGGAVDLSASPDLLTLLSSGRFLPAVPAVHLFTSWVLLKLGFVGLLAMGLFLAGCLREVVCVLSPRSAPDPFDVLMAMLFSAGLVFALPAATDLFTTPLPLLAVGILVARRRERRGLGAVRSSGSPAPTPV